MKQKWLHHSLISALLYLIGHNGGFGGFEGRHGTGTHQNADGPCNSNNDDRDAVKY